MTDEVHDDKRGDPPLGLGCNEGLGLVPERWYCVDAGGVAMLCSDEADARAQAAENNSCWPRRAPHRAVLLGDVAAERERCAKLCEEVESQAWALWKTTADPIEQGRNIGAQHCADAIRA